jgi:hypothetical protein
VPPQHMENFSRPLEMMQCQAFRWHKMFSEGRTLVGDEQRSGPPLAARAGDNIARVRELVRSDRRLTERFLMKWTWTGKPFVCYWLKNGGIRKICAKMVPGNLTEEQLGTLLNAVFDIQVHYGDGAASLVTWPRTLRLLFISKSKIGSERTPF